MKLTDYLDVLAYDIGFWMAALRNPDYPVAQLGAVSMDVAAKLRAAAIIALLGKGESDGFCHNLMRSARCRVQYLERLRAAGITDDHHQASARIGPFLDAVAAADFITARQIVALSRRDWLPGHEYQDDYCYAQIVHGLITVPTDLTRLEALFTQYQQVLDGRADARLDVTRAIARRNQAEFDVAFEALLAQHAVHIEAEKARKRIEEPGTIAARQVYVEGLALLQIATRLKFATQREYAYCPSLARVPMQQPFPGE